MSFVSFALIILGVGLVTAQSDNSCDDLTGLWRNKKGSVLEMKHDLGEVNGTYFTAVESSKGAAGNGARPITGTFNNGNLAYIVKFPNSLAAFTGQCFKTNEKEILYTTWILHSNQANCTNYWMATRVGTDIFKRTNSATATNEPCDGANDCSPF